MIRIAAELLAILTFFTAILTWIFVCIFHLYRDWVYGCHCGFVVTEGLFVFLVSLHNYPDRSCSSFLCVFFTCVLTRFFVVFSCGLTLGLFVFFTTILTDILPRFYVYFSRVLWLKIFLVLLVSYCNWRPFCFFFPNCPDGNISSILCVLVTCILTEDIMVFLVAYGTWRPFFSVFS